MTRRLVPGRVRPDARLQLIVVRSATGPVEDDRVVRALVDAGLPHLLLNTGETTYLLTRAGPQARSVLGTLAELRAGASRPFAVGTRLGPAAPRGALGVRPAPTTPGCRSSGTAATRSGAGRWRIHGSLRSLVGSVLGAAQAYDRDHDSDLVRTVQTWLERERQAGPAAEALHIHPNTLAYRLRRFEEVSGRNLRSTADLAELWLALRALRAPAGRAAGELSCCRRVGPQSQGARKGVRSRNIPRSPAPSSTYL